MIYVMMIGVYLFFMIYIKEIGVILKELVEVGEYLSLMLGVKIGIVWM